MIQRDVAFWDDVASHEAVAPRIFMGLPQATLAPLVDNPDAFPLASINGGAIFVPVDPLGFAYEMHTMYKPEGWGREVHAHAKKCFKFMFERASLLVTHEQEGEQGTSPPKSFGWAVAGAYKDVGLPRRLRLWVLTPQMWTASVVGRKQCQL